jgi:prophage regulatory protein
MAHPTQLIDLNTIIARTGMSRMTVHRRMKAGEFPQPIKLSPKMNRWTEGDLEAWIMARAAVTRGASPEVRA